GISDLLDGRPHRNDRDALWAQGQKRDGDRAVSEVADRLIPTIAGGTDQGGRKEVERQIRKIEAVLLDIGQPLRLVPDDHHRGYYSYTKNARSSIKVYKNSPVAAA